MRRVDFFIKYIPCKICRDFIDEYEKNHKCNIKIVFNEDVFDDNKRILECNNFYKKIDELSKE